MYSFKNDYSEWCHPSILEKLVTSNLEQLEGYWDDTYCEAAREAIKKQTKNDADIYFVSWWTQANAIIIASILRPHEAVIAAHTGHINVHEAWAIEATGHKVETVQSSDWKLTPTMIESVLYQDHHMVKPKLVYISNATEVWTLYTKEELMAIRQCCDKNNLYFFMDWARLWSALQATWVTMEEVATLTDVFYIWGTKNGALLWEAIVINNDSLKADFLYHIKQRWWLLAKGRLLWVQFLALFKWDLFLELASHANDMAAKLTQWIKNASYTFLTDSTSNQIFPILPTSVIEKLREEFDFYVREKINDTHSAIRLVTSWATDKDAVERFIATLS